MAPAPTGTIRGHSTPTKDNAMTITQHTRTPNLLDDLTAPAPTRAQAAEILFDYIPQVPSASPVTEAEEYGQARRVLSAAVHHDLNTSDFEEAVLYGDQLRQVRDGACLTHMFGEGHGQSRDQWESYLEVMMSLHIDNLTSGIPE